MITLVTTEGTPSMDEARQTQIQNHLRRTSQIKLDVDKQKADARKAKIREHLRRTQS